MGNDGVHLVTVVKCSTQFLVLLLDDAFGGHERDLLGDAHHEFLLVERLGQEITRSHLEAVYEILRCIHGCQEDDGDILGILALLQDDGGIKTVEVGHHHVEQYQVGMLLTAYLDAVLTIAGGTYLKFLIRQQNLEQQHVADHIVDYQNLIIATIYFRL